jgi:hypothetical protein
MIQCPYCGVEVEENANFCSLCGAPFMNKSAENETGLEQRKLQQEEKLLTDYQKLSGLQKRKIFLTISGIILISGMILTLLIDLVVNRNITWSKYPATVSFVLFINLAMNTFWRNKMILFFGFSFLSTAALLILLDSYAVETGWELKQGIPVLLAAYVTVFLLRFMIKKSKQKGLNIIAYSLLASGLLCICTDGIISLYSENSLNFGWSLIVMFSVAFISMLLLYIHYRLKKATNLKRFFHL